MITVNLNLSEGMQRELDLRMRDGTYATVEDYVRDLIEADLADDAWEITPEIAAAIDEAEASGFEPYDRESILAEARAKFHGE